MFRVTLLVVPLACGHADFGCRSVPEAFCIGGWAESAAILAAALDFHYGPADTSVGPCSAVPPDIALLAKPSSGGVPRGRLAPQAPNGYVPQIPLPDSMTSSRPSRAP